MAVLMSDRAAEKICAERLSTHGITISEFAIWIDKAENDLGQRPGSKLEFVPGECSRRFDYHQYRSLETVGAKKFRVIWDLDWDSSGQFDVFRLLELRIIPL